MFHSRTKLFLPFLFTLLALTSCKKRSNEKSTHPAKRKSEAQKEREKRAIEQVKEAKTAKGFSIDDFVKIFIERTNAETMKKLGQPFLSLGWNAECTPAPVQEIVSDKPLTEEERKAILAGLPLPGVSLADGGQPATPPTSRPNLFPPKDDPADAGQKSALPDTPPPDSTSPTSAPTAPRFSRCEVSLRLGSPKDPQQLHALWLVGEKNVVPQNPVARMLMQEASEDDFKENKDQTESRPTEKNTKISPPSQEKQTEPSKEKNSTR